MRLRSRTLVLALLVIATMAFGLTPAPAATRSLVMTDAIEAFAPQLITIDTPTRADKDRLNSMGLDLTEHAGHDYIEAVIYTQDELDLLAGEGFTWDVRIADMLQRQVERIEADQAFAAANPTTAIPSERNAYRVLADFGTEIDALAAAHPEHALRISIGESVEGRDLTGIEIGANIATAANEALADDGRPVFLMFGAHHAREWPSAEVPMEFAHDLLQAFSDDTHADHDRVVDLLNRGRIIIVPVSNPDGYDASRTTGDIVDLTGTVPSSLYNPVTIIGTPGNAYKRKNCRYIDGQTHPAGTCVAVPSPGGFGTGIDLNRNYGALWGGPGADDVVASATYHGPAPFSEPETQAIRNLISTRQVTTLISNHTFSNLLLRPVGVAPATIHPDGFPVGFAPDECFTTEDGRGYGMQELGERMTAQTGYSNQFGWELYDTTGTTEDYSYNATGGYGYTFEIGADEFHPPFEDVIDEYLGTSRAAQDVAEGLTDPAGLTTGAAADCGHDVDHSHGVAGGLRESFLIAFENAVNVDTHSVLAGSAPAGATLTLSRTGTFPTWDNTQVPDTVTTSIQVGDDGAFEWHVNPSTRPFVDSRMAPILSDALDSMTATDFAAPSAHAVPTDIPFTVEGDRDLLVATVSGVVSASGLAVDLNEHYVKLLDPSGNQVASAEGFGASNTLSWDGDGNGVPAGEYTVRVDNYLNPGLFTVSADTYDIVGDATPESVEQWTLTCTTADGATSEADVVVARGEAVVDLTPCA